MARRLANRATIATCVVLCGCNLLSGADDLEARDLPQSAAPGPGSRAPVDPGGPTAPFDAATVDGQPPPVGADAADGADAGAHRPDGGRFVFVTSTSSNGNLAGVAGADAKCTSLANAAGLGGTWVAWLSVSENAGVDASGRVKSGGSWYLVTGQLVVKSRSDLFGDDLDHAIDRDESGNVVQNQFVWTGTRRGVRAGASCNAWKTSSLLKGTTGTTSTSSSDWTSQGLDDCADERRLYCFEN